MMKNYLAYLIPLIIYLILNVVIINDGEFELGIGWIILSYFCYNTGFILILNNNFNTYKYKNAWGNLSNYSLFINLAIYPVLISFILFRAIYLNLSGLTWYSIFLFFSVQTVIIIHTFVYPIRDSIKAQRGRDRSAMIVYVAFLLPVFLYNEFVLNNQKKNE